MVRMFERQAVILKRLRTGLAAPASRIRHRIGPRLSIGGLVLFVVDKGDEDVPVVGVGVAPST
ncbi:MAG: hypothetical protein JWO74_4095 [Solirubrobacterales bacterium]|nr:hypothetical protein [Solirubrobacterales bacterium]